MSQFGKIPELPADEVFALTADFKNDKFPNKVNLGQGVYRDENTQPWVLPSVKEARKILLETPNLDHEYLPIIGSTTFLDLARELVLGPEISSKSNAVSVQTISGTGANHLGAMFLAEQLKPKHVFISAPTWGNHHLIWTVAGPQVTQKTYPYYNPKNRSLDYEGMISTLETQAVENDVVILHACAHNPTGIDLTRDQWSNLAQLFKLKKLFAFFDSAYQGFATGDLEADAWAVRHFQQTLLDPSEDASAQPAGLCIAQSFAKNFGLYGERAGAFHLTLPANVPTAGAKSQLLRIVRAEISNPPLFGARIVQIVLSDARLRGMWEQDLRTMAGRIKGVRALLRREIEKHPGVGDWGHIESQIGMFSYTGLGEKHVRLLIEEYHIYLMKSGRVSMSGLNPGNVKYVGDAIADVVKRVQAGSPRL
ncbi:hypothetical protein B9Z65_5474 [Elsinoe australis]|uniref:Aspartate aminotransferase n=1 Tax=Elsinoe australis TaxID=40998 RepID=A0A2P7ZE60_9PEZI|nr:hypothetical protein B9Z65_5474 [Elsinoe australis]